MILLNINYLLSWIFFRFFLPFYFRFHSIWLAANEFLSQTKAKNYFFNFTTIHNSVLFVCSLPLPSELMMIEGPTYQTDEWNINMVNAWFAVKTTEMLNLWRKHICYSFDCIFQFSSQFTATCIRSLYRLIQNGKRKKKKMQNYLNEWETVLMEYLKWAVI